MQTREKTDFPFKKSTIVTHLQNHGEFMWIYNRIHKKAEKLQFFRQYSSLLVRSIKQAKIRKNQGGSHLYLLKTACFNFNSITCRINRNRFGVSFSSVTVPNLKNTCHMDIISIQRTFTFNLLDKKGRCTAVLSKMFYGIAQNAF